MKNVIYYPDFEEGSTPDLYGDYPDSPDWNLVTELSGQMYEKQQCNATMAFIEEECNISDIEFTIKFKDPIPFDRSNLRLIRKHLQTSDQNHVLMIKQTKRYFDEKKDKIDKKMKVIGISRLNESEIKDKNILLVNITEHMVWHAKKKGEFLFEYKDGYINTEIPEVRFKNQIEKAKKLLKKLFNINEKNLVWLDTVIKVLKDTKHGAVIVVHKDADKEVKRLASPCVGHGTRMEEPLKLKDANIEKIETVIKQTSKIDGGFLFNPNGELLAYGVIFDGNVPKNKHNKVIYGNPARGSRYNSLLLYTLTQNQVKKKKRCMAIVFSDDLSIDILPSDVI